MKKGDFVQTRRFGKVRIEDIYDSEFKARMAGYTETTHYWDDVDYGIYGKSLDMYHMEFAAFRKNK